MKTFFAGDVCSTKTTESLYAAKDTATLFGNVATLLEGCDLACVNLECAITESENAIPKFGPNLKAPAGTADVLKELGVTLCGISNNHVFDFGIEGAVDTMKELDRVGIPYTGFGNNYEDSRKNYTFEKDGERICVIAVCEHEYSYAIEDRMGARPFDVFDTMEDIENAKKTHDRVIVLYHGAKEMCRYPSPRLIKVCHAMAKHGADLVIGQHSHCIGAYEQFEGCHIFYGQGNFQFVRKDSTSELWNTCLAVNYDTKTHEITFTPVRANPETGTIALAEGEDKETLLAEFAARNASLHDGTWKDGWHAFCEEKKQDYEKVLRRACVEGAEERHNACFGHYLDCEAHTDVWRELFPTYNQFNETERDIRDQLDFKPSKL